MIFDVKYFVAIYAIYPYSMSSLGFDSLDFYMT